jgi:hypothetical protein
MTTALKYHLVALVGLQLLLCFLYGYHDMYKQRPYSIHQWRQTDCTSFTKNYYEEGMHFFQPHIHWQGKAEGKTVGEFPLINYTVACLWKIFGEHESIYRFTVFCLYLVAMLFLFVMMYAVSGSFLYGYFATSLFTTSPVLAYYSFSFLADVPALSFSIIGLSLFVRFMQQQKKGLFIAAVAFATLATLLKVSSVTVLVIIGVISTITVFRFPRAMANEKKLVVSTWLQVLVFGISAGIIYSWYHFAFLYNGDYSNTVFLMKTLPVWKMEKAAIVDTAKLLYSDQLPMCFNKGMLLALVLICFFLLMNLKRLLPYMRMMLLVSLASFVGFILLFFQAFNVHDYYLITSMIFPVIMLLCLGSYLKNLTFPVFHKKMIALLVFVFGINAVYCASEVRMRNFPNDKLCRYNPAVGIEEKEFSDWRHYLYDTTMKPLEKITPYLRSLGIRRTDKVISAPDPSFNITLYLMDQKGFTATKKSLLADTGKVSEYISLGATYFVLNDTTLSHCVGVKKHIGPKIGQYKNIAIYKALLNSQNNNIKQSPL